MHAELRKGGRPDATRDEAGTEGNVWHPRCVVKAAWKAGYRMQKVERDPTEEGAVDLRVILKSDGVYAIEGIQNKTYYHGKRKVDKWGPNVEGPEVVPNEWRHVIAWKDGVGLDWEFDETTGKRHADGGVVPLADLWLRAGNKVKPGKGYFRKILKVYKITPRAVKRGADELVPPSAAPPSPLAKVGPPRISLEEAIRTRNFAAIAAKSEQLANPRNETRFSPALLDAAKCNDVELLACLLTNGCPGRDEVCETAAAHGHLACLQYAHEHGCAWDKDTCRSAAAHGHLACLQYAHEHGCAWGKYTCVSAATNGHLACLAYAHEHGCAWDKDTCTLAAMDGRLDCLAYAHEHGCAWDEDTCTLAASNGHLDCLTYAHEHGCAWDEDTCMYAAENGHLDCLAYAHEHGCAWNASTCMLAARNGHLACLTYAHEHGCAWSSYTCMEAAKNGHLACLTYAHEHGCAWNASTCTLAARNGHLACLTYAHEHSCEWDEDTCWLAARNGHLACLVYAHEHGCEWDENTFSGAHTSRHLACLRYLLRQGCPVGLPSTRRSAAQAVCRGLLWPKVRLAFRVRHWWFKFQEAHHGTAAASLKIQLDSLANDEEMLPLAPAVAPVAAAGANQRTVRQLARCGGVKRGADGEPIDPFASKLRRHRSPSPLARRGSPRATAQTEELPEWVPPPDRFAALPAEVVSLVLDEVDDRTMCALAMVSTGLNEAAHPYVQGAALDAFLIALIELMEAYFEHDDPDFNWSGRCEWIAEWNDVPVDRVVAWLQALPKDENGLPMGEDSCQGETRSLLDPLNDHIYLYSLVPDGAGWAADVTRDHVVEEVDSLWECVESALKSLRVVDLNAGTARMKDFAARVQNVSAGISW